MKVMDIKLNSHQYKIFFKRNILNEVPQYLKDHFSSKRIAIITDHNVRKLYGEGLLKDISDTGFEAKIISIRPGEESKNLNTLEKVYGQLSAFGITRGDLIITMGGGVTGDLGGFAAATYLRGVPYIQIPTSLLAQVDSSIGGKVAVDLPWGKNLVGSFYHPEAVFIDPQVLSTLDKRFFSDGIAEVIKYGCIMDETIINSLMNLKGLEDESMDSLIYKCCGIKKILVEKDERDFGERMLLNFGHTLGHGVEKYYDYKRFTHGEAVAIGMAHITRNTEILGITEPGTVKRLEEVLEKFELPSTTPDMEMEKVYDAINLDKKNSSGFISIIVITKIGNGIIKKIEKSKISDYI